MLYCECGHCKHNKEFDCTLKTPGVGEDGKCLYIEPDDNNRP